MSADVQKYKHAAAEAALEYVQSGMVLGLGHGSTVAFALEGLAARLRQGDLKDVVGIPCSRATAEATQKLGIPLSTLEEHPEIDLTIDGADEVDPNLNLIKGGGGALLREKIVAQASRREIIVVDESKLSDTLGSRFPLPVEISPFGWKSQLDFLDSLARTATLREQDGAPVQTDQGNYLIDCDFGPIENLYKLAQLLEGRAGILEHGLFLGLVTDLFVGGPEGVRHQRSA